MSATLLDTHVLLWWLADDRKPSASFRRVIAGRNNACIVSAATIWEIGIKRALGKLDAPQKLVGVIQEEGFPWIRIFAGGSLRQRQCHTQEPGVQVTELGLPTRKSPAEAGL